MPDKPLVLAAGETIDLKGEFQHRVKAVFAWKRTGLFGPSVAVE
jgi:hypothetical protein